MATHSSILTWKIPWTEEPGRLVKNLPTLWETWVQSLGWEEPLEGTAAHSSILAWRILWTIVHGVKESQVQRVRRD